MPSIARLQFVLILSLVSPAFVFAQREKPSLNRAIAERLIAGKDWQSEVIKLPPAFAPDMKFKGEEHIRFAPGMFKAESEDFFTYLFVFEVQDQKKMTEQQIQAEMLAYYRGLAKAVWKKKDVPLNVEKFRFDLKARETPKGEVGDFFHGELTWKEPFVTSADQVLHMEIQSWNESIERKMVDGKTASGKPEEQAEQITSYLLICVSPVSVEDTTSEIWNTMRKIRMNFHK